MTGVVVKSKTGKISTGALYRGVLVRSVEGTSSLTKNQIRKAVKAAIDKNANAFANVG